MPKVVSRSAVSTSTDGARCSLIPPHSHPLQPVQPRPRQQLCASTVRQSPSAWIPTDFQARTDCICGEFILVIDKSIASLPRRQTDGAIIIRAQDSEGGPARVFKLNAVAGEPVLLERPGGHERQFRFLCPRCTLPIGYQCTPPPVKTAPYVYIFTGALTQMQGQVPHDAFDGENDD
ncbi:hypothetical protein C8J57DRAFT_1171860 [Mycena rebaudengoi]|nr:hypothetical protein C8J57DRAFT_1171860 [Mycena rebaudengoi]